MTYVDVRRTEEGEVCLVALPSKAGCSPSLTSPWQIMPDYVVWINKAIRDAKPFGLPDSYAEKYLRPYIPPTTKEEEERDVVAVRVMSPRGTGMPG
jgi:hypothetical protein